LELVQQRKCVYNIYLQHAAARVADEREYKLLVPKHAYPSDVAQFIYAGRKIGTRNNPSRPWIIRIQL
jgi:hypothetical protein